MPLIMKLRFQLVMLMLACFALAGCHANQTLISHEVLIGSYGYLSKDPATSPTDHNLDHLVLRADWTYDLVEGGTTKAVAEKNGTWKIVPGDPPNLLLDHAGYPIEIKQNEVRLLIDLDTGIWWVKPR
jgi:hypothetical protein